MWKFTFCATIILSTLNIHCKSKKTNGVISIYGETLDQIEYGKELLYVNKNMVDSEGFTVHASFKMISRDSLIPHGFNKSFYADNTLRSFTNIRLGKLFGSTYVYSSLGKIDKYLFYDTKGNLRKLLEYNKHGELITNADDGILESYVLYEMLKNDSMQVRILSPDIPHLRRNFTYTSKNCDHRIEKDLEEKRNLDIFTFIRDTCKWNLTIRFYNKDSLVYNEELLLTEKISN